MNERPQQAAQFCQAVVNHMLKMRGVIPLASSGARLPRYLSDPLYQEACNDIFYEISGGCDPELDRIYIEGFVRAADPKWVAQTIQNLIWDR